ncbi:MAG: 3-isopropylmalate dehydratase small subunit, partial [Duodenibacillus sp.]|nr:3-isopropylmalate dehydratase small subunit [Duodenibacillus sp.]
MEKLIRLASVALPLPIDNLDTDQIMPKQFLRGIDKKGLARGAFYNMRFLPDGSPNPESVFNRPGYEGASIIVAGPNYGCGSSREHAVWGPMQMGIRCVVSSSFGEIFYSNCFNN